MKQKKKSDVAVLLGYAGSHKGLTFLGLALSAVSMLLSMAPYICIWLAARDLIAVAPDWTKAQSVAQYGWLAFAFAVAGIILYFAGLMCTHLAAFRTASNIRKQGVAHVMKAPLGFFDSNASGLIRGRLDAAAADTETLLAHNLADIVGTITLFVAMLVMMLVFDWRMGAACLLAAVISIVAMFSMMGGKTPKSWGNIRRPWTASPKQALSTSGVSRWSRSSSRRSTPSRRSRRRLRTTAPRPSTIRRIFAGHPNPST